VTFGAFLAAGGGNQVNAPGGTGGSLISPTPRPDALGLPLSVPRSCADGRGGFCKGRGDWGFLGGSA